MRFAYIDSQGNEVTIPSVDALALRIELGAIGADTALYDAQADRWGPAQSHEIFHTLSRAVDDDRLMAPMPVVPPPPRAVEPPPPAAAESEGFGPDLSEEPADDPEMQLEVIALAPDRPLPEQPGEAAEDLGLRELDLAPGRPPAKADERAAAAVAPAEGGFDFGDLGGGLELEPGLGEEVAASLAPADELDFGGSPAVPGGMGLESPIDFVGGPVLDADRGAGFETEPKSASKPDGPPAWMEQHEPPSATEDDLLDFLPAAVPDVSQPAAPRQEERRRFERSEPRSRPSAPRRVRSKVGAGPLVLLVLIAVVGGGGYYAWQTFRSEVGEIPQRPAVAIPVIPEELLPQMRELASAALRGTFVEIDERSTPEAADPEPREEWLAGVYLANASRFEDVEQFWQGISQFATMLQQDEQSVFHDRYVAETVAAGVDAVVADQLIERADSGFVTTQTARFQAYGQLQDLATAALDLHAFLLTHEGDIAYTPATGFSRNPVEEVVPNTQALSDEMWDMVEDITNALDALGTLDRVTRQRLSDVLFARIAQIGIR